MTDKLRKAGIRDVLDLALCVPHRYYDYRIKERIDESEMLFEVTVGAKTKLARLTKWSAYAHNISQEIELIFFHLSPYHDKIFTQGAKLYVAGKVQRNYGKIQLIQPQKIAAYKVGRIFPSYKVPIRGDIFEELKRRYLTREALLEEGLPEDIAEAFLTIHYPDEAFYKEFKRHGEFFGKHLEALKFTEAYRYMRGLKIKRKNLPALCSFQADPTPFIASLPFALTKDQRAAIEDIRRDLAKPTAAKRVVVGDVGSGKSMVMFATAFMAGKRRAILMAPTTILAAQLFEEAKKYLDIPTVLVSATNKEEDLERYDFIIGTHALLYRTLPKACVIMVDEQHRFGTEQRNRLKKLTQEGNKVPHFFQFSATPIPRTQAMMESSLVDFSFIRQTPYKKDITTKIVSKEDFKDIIAHIAREIAQDHQVLIIYPLVEERENYGYKSLEEAARFWQEHFDGVYVTHGKDKQKDEVLKEFRNKGKILLATTVVEVGISLPRLSTILIVGAENLGLATLHQLRGRVSRTGLKGYCFLYTNDKNNERLQKFAKLTSGFEVAELDLAYRRSGDILTGKEQSGKAFRFLNMAEDKEIVARAKALLS